MDRLKLTVFVLSMAFIFFLAWLGFGLNVMGGEGATMEKSKVKYQYPYDPETGDYQPCRFTEHGLDCNPDTALLESVKRDYKASQQFHEALEKERDEKLRKLKGE